mmetsp:Transcript_67870/g.196408  ORF Transcript_67870/g.196408 Transcript_67870/m.196408 type:complete len:398 (-) Transcript_67870:28-1221(-)
MSDNSNNRGNNTDGRGRGLPSYYPPMPANPKRNMDEHVHETTRRVGGTKVTPSMRPMPIAFQNPSMTMPTISAVTSKPQVSISSASKFVWRLSTAPELPEFHSVERTAVFVPHSTPSLVASRISDLLRERSIQATYDDEKAKVKCVTVDGVDFRVRLYRGRNEYSHGIIVEVQRRFGFSIHFHDDTQAILDAAQGKPPAEPAAWRNALPEVVSDDEDDDDYSPPPPSGASSLAVVEKMLIIPGFDAQYLGLQTLSFLTEPERMSMPTARRASAALLKADSEVGKRVFRYIVDRKTEDEDYVSLRVMALGILANAMRTTGMIPEFLRSSLRPVLLEDIKHAEENTNAALVAARCIEYFIHNDTDTMELNEAFEVARRVGEARHCGLMEQAERCISRIR